MVHFRYLCFFWLTPLDGAEELTKGHTAACLSFTVRLNTENNKRKK